MLKNKKFAELIEPFEIRKKNVLNYLFQIKPNLNVEVNILKNNYLKKTNTYIDSSFNGSKWTS